MCSLRSNSQYVIIGSDNGLAPISRQAIIWTNYGLVYWRIYVSLCLNELNRLIEIRQCYSIHNNILMKYGMPYMIATTILTHWGRDKMADILQTTFSNAFFLNENVWILPKISLECVPKVRINTIAALAQIIAWRRPGNKQFSETMVISLLTHICVTRPQWVKP